MKLVHKFFLGFASVVLLLLITSTINIIYMSEIHEDVHIVSQSNVGELQGAVDVAYMTAELNHRVTQYLLALYSGAGESDGIRESITAAIDNVQAAFNTIVSASQEGKALAETEEYEEGEEEEIREALELQETFENYARLVETTFDIVENRNIKEAVAFYTKETGQFKAAIKSGALDLYEDAIGEVKAEVEEVDESIEQARRLTVVI